MRALSEESMARQKVVEGQDTLTSLRVESILVEDHDVPLVVRASPFESTATQIVELAEETASTTFEPSTKGCRPRRAVGGEGISGAVDCGTELPPRTRPTPGR